MSGIRTSETNQVKKNSCRKATPNLKVISLCIEGENRSLAEPICDSDSKVSSLIYQGFNTVPGLFKDPKSIKYILKSARVFHQPQGHYQKWNEDTSEVE